MKFAKFYYSWIFSKSIKIIKKADNYVIFIGWHVPVARSRMNFWTLGTLDPGQRWIWHRSKRMMKIRKILVFWTKPNLPPCPCWYCRQRVGLDSEWLRPQLLPEALRGQQPSRGQLHPQFRRSEWPSGALFRLPEWALGLRVWLFLRSTGLRNQLIKLRNEWLLAEIECVTRLELNTFQFRRVHAAGKLVIAIEFVGLLIKHELYYFFHFGLPAQSIAMSIAFCLEIVTGISATERLRWFHCQGCLRN